MTPLEAKTICIDIDDTLCRSSGPDGYAEASPVEGAREFLQRLSADGWVVVLFTGRHFNHWQVTVEWLAKHGFVYDQIVFGKPPARFYVDNRAIPFEGDWEPVYRRINDHGQGE